MKNPFTKTTRTLFLAITLAGFAGQRTARAQASPSQPATLPEAAPAPANAQPLPTPPATMAARNEAVARHPALGYAGSAFNSEFLTKMRCYQSEKPAYFQNPRWPLALANEIAAARNLQRNLAKLPQPLAPLPSLSELPELPPLPPVPPELPGSNGTGSGPRLIGRTVYAHADAPVVIKSAMVAGNALQTKPYKWGGGHGRTEDSGYDCSGSVSYVLMKAGLLNRTLTSRGFASYGEPGPGRFITIYAGNGHVFMSVCGIRLDTGGRAGRGESGPRWTMNPRYGKGFVMRHPPGF